MPIIRRAGRPGLLGIAARTAVAAGTATAVSGAVARHQQERAAEDAAQPASPSPAAAGALDVAGQLQQLAVLHQQGVLSAEEFALAKRRLLGS